MHDSDVVRSALQTLCEDVSSVRSLGIWLCLSSKSDSELVGLTTNAEYYSDAAAFAKDYALTECLKKYSGLKLGLDTKAAALSGWKQSEERCRTVNDEGLTHRITNGKDPVRANEVFHLARRKIASVLGPCHVGTVLSGSDWSRGATFFTRRGTTVDSKMTSDLSVTPAAMRYARAFLETDWHWAASILGVYPSGPFSLLGSVITTVPGAKWSTVAKNAKTDRCICIEPSLNIFLQKGVGRFIRRRLKGFGIDLDDQTRNQSLAQAAFSCGLCTVDLSAASDSISHEIVASLLPIDWYVLLDDLRSPRALVDGSWEVLEKFSSMGNGFTFELESLIFWALTSSVGDVLDVHRRSGDVSAKSVIGVYGDDIICPRRWFPLLSDVLGISGFSVNYDKSFVDGSFFESCGKHYWQGVDVTPFYQKVAVPMESRGLVNLESIRMHNRIARWCIRVFGASRVRVSKRTLDRLVGKSNFRIPDFAEGDDGYLTPLPSKHFSYDENHGIRCQVVSMREVSKAGIGSPLYALWLRRAHLGLSPQELSRVSTQRVRVRASVRFIPWTAVPDRTSLGG